MPWSYDKATDTLTVTGGTVESPITLDDFDGELDISADPIVIKNTTVAPVMGGYFSADKQPVVGGNLATKLYAIITGTPTVNDRLWIQGKDAWNVTKTVGRGGCGGMLATPSSGYCYYIAASIANEIHYRLRDEIFDSGIEAYRDNPGVEWSFKIEQREVQLITKAADGSYVVHCNLHIGDGTNATCLASIGEVVRFAAGKTLTIASNATLRLGERYPDTSSGWGRNGSAWTLAPSATMDLVAAGATNAVFEQYASLLRIASNHGVALKSGTWYARNAVIGGCYQPGGNTGCSINTMADVTIDWKRVQIANFGQYGVQGSTMTRYEDVHLHSNQNGIRMIGANMTLVKPCVTEYASNDYLADSVGTSYTFDVLDPVHNVANPLLTNYLGEFVTTTLREQYSCNMTLVNASGNPIEGVTVKCYDQNDNLVFEAETDEDGAIAEQKIVYKQWEKVSVADTVETCYSPHKFTFERAGYATLVMDSVYVDSPIYGGIEWRVPMSDSTSAPARRGITYIGP